MQLLTSGACRMSLIGAGGLWMCRSSTEQLDDTSGGVGAMIRPKRYAYVPICHITVSRTEL